MTEISYPFIDYENHRYHINEELYLELQPISALALMLVRNSQAGKPTVPEVETVYAGGRTVTEKNYNDPKFLEALDEWDRVRNINLTKYVIYFGIKTNTPEDVTAMYKGIFPDMSESEIKYLWICSLVKDVEKFGELTGAIIGQTTITEKGMSAAAETFPDEGKQQTN